MRAGLVHRPAAVGVHPDPAAGPGRVERVAHGGDPLDVLASRLPRLGHLDLGGPAAGRGDDLVGALGPDRGHGDVDRDRVPQRRGPRDRRRLDRAGQPARRLGRPVLGERRELAPPGRPLDERALPDGDPAELASASGWRTPAASPGARRAQPVPRIPSGPRRAYGASCCYPRWCPIRNLSATPTTSSMRVDCVGDRLRRGDGAADTASGSLTRNLPFARGLTLSIVTNRPLHAVLVSGSGERGPALRAAGAGARRHRARPAAARRRPARRPAAPAVRRLPAGHDRRHRWRSNGPFLLPWGLPRHGRHHRRPRDPPGSPRGWS